MVDIQGFDDLLHLLVVLLVVFFEVLGQLTNWKAAIFVFVDLEEHLTETHYLFLGELGSYKVQHQDFELIR